VRSFATILQPLYRHEPWYVIRGGSFKRPLTDGVVYEWTSVPAASPPRHRLPLREKRGVRRRLATYSCAARHGFTTKGDRRIFGAGKNRAHFPFFFCMDSPPGAGQHDGFTIWPKRSGSVSSGEENTVICPKCRLENLPSATVLRLRVLILRSER